MKKTNFKRTAGKTKKNKRGLATEIGDYFRKYAGKTITFKKVCKDLKYTSHPLKMLALDVIEDLVLDQFLIKGEKEGSWTLSNMVGYNAVLAEFNLPTEYPAEVEEAANKISGDISKKELKQREDFRSVWTCTIDPADAKDFDDALSIRKLDNLWEVGVHIADVSHYVKENDIIDKEAQKRATSVYLVDRTIPMLPERLCNGICSLRPNEEKMAFSVIFNLNDKAEIQNYRIVHTVINSNHRYTYEQAQELIKGDDPEGNVSQLWTLAKQLRDKRFNEGSVMFESEEMKFELDTDGKPIGCYFKQLHESNHLVEEFMLLANKTVAESIGKVPKGKKAKTLPYRIHDVPDIEKLGNLKDYVSRFGYKMKSTKTQGATSKAINKLMADCSGKPEERLIQSVVLRAMAKAAYSVHNIGHYGLAFDYYTHFTSPIRRYPDLMVHRLITRYAAGEKSANSGYYEELCKHCSEMEIQAAIADRESVKFKMVEFMAEKIGQEYDAHISGITSFGIYCMIDENHCEGFIPVRALKEDYFDYNEDEYAMIGRRHGITYRLGDPLKIQVLSTNLDKRQINFTLV